jgi:hypothetical protein
MAGVFLVVRKANRKSELHGCDKVWYEDGGMFLQQLSHAGGHAGVH